MPVVRGVSMRMCGRAHRRAPGSGSLGREALAGTQTLVARTPGETP